MFELVPEFGWLLFAYAVGTAFGWYMGFKNQVRNVSEVLIDSLIEKGYLKYRKDANGEIEILKYNED